MNVFETITSQIMAKLEQGVVPWHQPWNSTAGMPRNLLSQKAYRGINVWVLASAGYSSPYWLTYKQALEIGGHVRKGEHGAPVAFWKFVDRVEETQEEPGDRRLTGAARANDTDLLAGRDREGEAVMRRTPSAGIGEADILEGDGRQ